MYVCMYVCKHVCIYVCIQRYLVKLGQAQSAYTFAPPTPIFSYMETSVKRVDHSTWVPIAADADRSFSAPFSAISNANCPVIRPPSIIIGEDISPSFFAFLVAWYFYENNDP